jgi:acyl-CoA synthetase (AMP-forming)/AMP-acid ligase II
MSIPRNYTPLGLTITQGPNLCQSKIEATVRRSDPALTRGSTAVFWMNFGGQQRLVAVQEVDFREKVDLDGLIESIRGTVFQRHGIQICRLILAELGSIPTTSSGKVERSECESRLLQGRLRTVVEWRIL